MKPILCKKYAVWHTSVGEGCLPLLLPFRFRPKAEGYLTAAGRRFPVRDGEGTVDLTEAEDGIYPIAFHTAERSDEIARVEIRDGVGYHAAVDPARLFALTEEAEAQRKRIRAMEERLDLLEKKIGNGRSIEL